eukprot:973406-Prorocentrum_minimum.AAC.1
MEAQLHNRELHQSYAGVCEHLQGQATALQADNEVAAAGHRQLEGHVAALEAEAGVREEALRATQSALEVRAGRAGEFRRGLVNSGEG